MSDAVYKRSFYLLVPGAVALGFAPVFVKLTGNGSGYEKVKRPFVNCVRHAGQYIKGCRQIQPFIGSLRL
jgi:hypothetical protein